ncbi:Tetratricopeptide repeat family [Favolaschia claudopus]|uniref:Tetratricopeptide repeat family n=1 Tax=Favolaschia claudopus TaxID=2862362 RepID=A0AAW0A513_9AGAR
MSVHWHFATSLFGFKAINMPQPLNAVFVNLIELGEGIRSSIEKVGENRRQFRELTQDIVRTLCDLARLTHGKEGAFRGPELLGALENLKVEMLYVHSKCLGISPIQLPGLRGIPSHLKAWRKRDDLEKKIARLREHANKCLSQFTAFSAARTEHVAVEIAHTTLRIEQRLIVDNVENQAKTRRLEGLMARFMLESEFGQHKLSETVKNISADCSFQSLEYQYMSAQLRSLINLVKPLLGCEDLPLQTPSRGWNCDAISFGFIEPSLTTTPSHALFHILGIIVAIHSRDHASLMDLLIKAMDDLPACFNFAEMHSQIIIWGHFEIDLLRYMMKRGRDTGTLPHIADTLGEISRAHRRQSELDAAIGFSQQSLALWVEISHLRTQEVNRNGHLRSMIMHAKNLLAKDDKLMLSAAQDAVAFARPMVEALSIVSRGVPLTADEQYTTKKYCDALFVLAQTLSSLDLPLDSYEALLEASRTACSPLIFRYCPLSGHYIDFFLEVICTVAEAGHLSFFMLADCVELFRNLACTNQKQYSSEFLHVLHAFTYFSQQPNSYHPTEQIRLFLKPTYRTAPLAIDVTRPIPIDSSLLADVMRLFFAGAQWQCRNQALIQNILVAHFPQAAKTLRVVVQSRVCNKFVLNWVLRIACAVLPRLLPADYVTLLRILVQAVKGKSFHAISGVVAVYLASQSDAHPHAVVWLQDFLELWVVLLHDAARFPEAIDLVKQKGLMFGDLASGSEDLSLLVIKAQILQRVGRHKEALQLVRTGVADRIRKFCPERPTFDILLRLLYFLLPQLAWAWELIGRPAKALEHAKMAVTACQDLKTEEAPEELMICVQIHSLTTHSNCLATVGRTDEALESAQKAVSLYNEYSEYMGRCFIYPIRGGELGGNAFFALSLRLLAVDDSEEALLTTSDGIISRTRLLGREDEATAASEEAVDILRKVVDPETYFLPHFAEALDELAGFLTRRGETSDASTATAEAAAARLKFASLPPEPEWLCIQEVDVDEYGDFNWWDREVEEYHAALEGLANMNGAEADEGNDAGDPEFKEALDTTVAMKKLEGNLSPIFIAPGDGADQPSFEELNDMDNSGTAAAGEAAKGFESQGSLTSIVSKLVDIRLSMRSTLMDLIWWTLLMLLAILFALMYARVI